MKRLFLIFSLFALTVSYRQTYTFINKVVANNKKENVFLMDRFNADFRTDISSFNVTNFKEWWASPMDAEAPSIKHFLENFSLKHLRQEMKLNKTDSLINFKLLDVKFRKTSVNDLKKLKSLNIQEQEERTNNIFFNITKPIFNCSKSWAIIIIERFNPILNVYSGGELCVYKKIKNKWVIYHKIQLWVN